VLLKEENAIIANKSTLIVKSLKSWNAAICGWNAWSNEQILFFGWPLSHL